MSTGESQELVTPDEVSDQMHVVESVLSGTDVDDEFLAALLANQVQMARVERVENEILRSIRDQQDPGLIGEFPFEMSHSVPADTPTNDPNPVVRVPDEENESRIVAVSLGWPDGSNNAVGIQIATGNDLVLFPRNPEDQFVAFNDFSETFGLRYTLSPGEELVAKTVNLDTSNAHFVNIVAHIEEVA